MISGGGEALHLARLEERRRAADHREHHVEPARHDVLQAVDQPFVMHRLHLDAVQRVEPCHGEMVDAARADRPVVELAGIFLRVIDELADIRGREIGSRHEHQICRHDARHRREVLRRVVRQLAIQKGIERVDGVGGKQPVVAVRRRFRHVLCGDDLVGAGLVLHDHLLAPGVGQLLAERAHQQIRRPASGVGDDHSDRLGWIRLRLRERRRERQCGCK